jgi:hypothetical protein
MALQQDELGNWYDDGTDDGNSSDTPLPSPAPSPAPSTAGYYDEVTGKWVSDPNGALPGPLTNETSGTGTVGNYTNVQRFDDGSTLIMDKNGNVIGSTPSTDQLTGKVDTYAPSISDTIKNLGTKAVDSIKGYFQKKDAKGNPIPDAYDWAKIAGAGVALYGALGGSKPQQGGWQGSIPNYTASRGQIKYDDTNRRPGAQGRQYFTDVNYSGASTAPQAQGILDAYQPVQPAAPKWNAQNAVATPWARQPAMAGASGIGGLLSEIGTNTGRVGQRAAPLTSDDIDMLHKINPGLGNISSAPQPVRPIDAPEVNQGPSPDIGEPYMAPIKAATGGVMPLASGRYLQGATDGMADQINTSIDGRQPAKLSHGEFVIPADVVSHLGNGNSDAGAKKLYSMMDKVRQARTGTKKQGKQINPDKYMPGGTVNKYAAGGIAQLPTKKFVGGGSAGPATDTTTTSSLSPWAGDYVANMLGKGQALANAPYQAYTGPLTAGPSDLQQQQFAGLSSLAQTGLTPTQFSSGTFGTQQAQQYMNPYLSAALNPQLDELQRRSQINLQPDLAKLTQAGGYGGGRQAIMQSEANRNLLAEQNKTVGQGYATAYDKAMQQFNAEQNRGLDVQRAQEAANEASANYGLKSLESLGQAGATQRGIEQEGLAADKAQFEEQRDWPYKMVQYQQGLLNGLPISTQSNNTNMSQLTSLLASLGYGQQFTNLLNGLPANGTPAATTPAPKPATSSGVTSTGSSGVTGP